MSKIWVFISDIHMTEPILPLGDVLVVAGDITNNGSKNQCMNALNWIGSHKYENILLTPGNHELFSEEEPEEFKEMCKDNNITCLIDESIELHGKKVYMSPYSPYFNNWAWNAGRTLAECALYRKPYIKDIWAKIPLDTQILVTHGPAYGMLDWAPQCLNVGCDHLWDKILDLKDLEVHCAGHIHFSAGSQYFNGIKFLNSSICGENYKAVNEPIVLEI